MNAKLQKIHQLLKKNMIFLLLLSILSNLIYRIFPQVYAPSGPKPPMQRCPYIHEMRERFINDTPNQVYIMNRMERERDRAERENLLGNPKQSSARSDTSSNQVGTVVKVLLAITRA